MPAKQGYGQLAGTTSRHADGRYCIDMPDQLSAASAAVDPVAVLILMDRINASVRGTIEPGDTDEEVGELVTTVRLYVRSR